MSDRTPAQEGQTLAALQAIMTERQRQHEKWGVPRHDFTVWLTVLSEEVGELAQEILNYRAAESEYTETFFLDQRMPESANPEALARLLRKERDRAKDMRAEAVQVAVVAVAMIEHLDERIGELSK